MRKCFLLLLCLYAVLALLPAFAADKAITVFIDGQQKAFDPPAIVRDGKAYVPLRQIGTALGAGVAYNASTGGVTLTYCGKVIRLKASDGITVGTAKYVPLRMVGTAFGCKLNWDPATATVRITKPAGG